MDNDYEYDEDDQIDERDYFRDMRKKLRDFEKGKLDKDDPDMLMLDEISIQPWYTISPRKSSPRRSPRRRSK